MCFLQNVLDIISHWTWPQHSGGELPWVLTEVIARVGQDRAGMPSSRSEGKAGYDPSHEDWHRRSRHRADSSHHQPMARPGLMMRRISPMTTPAMPIFM